MLLFVGLLCKFQNFYKPVRQICVSKAIVKLWQIHTPYIIVSQTPYIYMQIKIKFLNENTQIVRIYVMPRLTSQTCSHYYYSNQIKIENHCSLERFRKSSTRNKGPVNLHNQHSYLSRHLEKYVPSNYIGTIKIGGKT